MDICVKEEKVLKKAPSTKNAGEIVLRVRRLTEEDLKHPESAARILEVITELITNEDIPDFTVLSDPNVMVIGIFEGMQVDNEFVDPFLIGMATANFKHTWSGWKLIVDDVIVSSKSRLRGIGRKLMTEMEKLGKEHDPPCTVVSLVSDRDEAFAFYFRLGYKTRGAQQFKKPIGGKQ